LSNLALKAGIANEHGLFGAKYSFDLDPRGKHTPCCPVQLAKCPVEYSDPCELASYISAALVAQSYENVLVGTDGRTLFVECESRRFTEQLDALAVAAAIAAVRCGPEIEWLVVTPKLDDVPQLSLSVRVDELLAFLADPALAPCGFIVSSYRAGGYPPDTVFAPEANKKSGHGELQLRLINSVEIARANEPSWQMRLGLGISEHYYPGRALSLRARQDWPFFNELTEKTDPVNRDATLTYFDHWKPGLFVLASGGYLGNERFGGLGEVSYYFDQGRYRLGGVYGYVRDQSEGEWDEEDGVGLGRFSYYEPALDWELTASGGFFQEEDKGVSLESTRYFGPMELSFFAYDTDGSAPHGGFRIYVPLLWFFEDRHGAFRAVGAPYLGYRYRTDSNPWGEVLMPGLSIASARQRLRPEYVRQHLWEFRRAVLLNLDDIAPCAFPATQ
jgi:hypothetical protein